MGLSYSKIEMTSDPGVIHIVCQDSWVKWGKVEQSDEYILHTVKRLLAPSIKQQMKQRYRLIHLYILVMKKVIPVFLCVFISFFDFCLSMFIW